MPNSISIIIDTSQLEQLTERITAAAASDKTRSDIGRIIGKELLDSTDRAFESGGENRCLSCFNQNLSLA